MAVSTFELFMAILNVVLAIGAIFFVVMLIYLLVKRPLRLITRLEQQYGEVTRKQEEIIKRLDALGNQDGDEPKK